MTEAVLKSKRIGKIFLAGNRIGQGTFGEVYSGINLLTKEKVAIKAEPVSANTNLVPHEAMMYKLLQGDPGIPKLYYSGTEYGFNILIIDLLGPSLQDFLDLHRPCLSMPTVLRLAISLLNTFEHIHSHHIIHRDVKPDNILLKCDPEHSEAFLIDYGVSKRITRGEKYVEHKSHLVGTARYQSINSHKGGTQTRRDDLESLGYSLVYLAKGRLTWQGMTGKTKAQKNTAILNMKIKTPLEEVCEGLPTEFQTYIQYCRSLHFEEKPDYEYLRGLFRSVMRRMELGPCVRYDWDDMKLVLAEFIRARESGGGMRAVKRDTDKGEDADVMCPATRPMVSVVHQKE